MHVRLCDVLDHHRDVPVPGTYGLVVRSRHEASVFVYECNRVDRSQVLVIFLGYLSTVNVILVMASMRPRSLHVYEVPYLNNLLVGHACKEDVLLVFIWVELDAIWDFAIPESSNAFSCLRIPEFHHSIETAREESSSIIGKRKVFDGFGVTNECPQTISSGIYVP